MDDLKYIKKHYGEKMMHLCRELFPSVLENEGLLVNLIESRFVHSKFLADDIISKGIEEDFKNYICSLLNEKKQKNSVSKSPEELLSEAGYDLFECKDESDIQQFRKYYKFEEELCTFIGGRLKKCYVFFAVKKDVDKIKREDFKNPERQDAYGTSVISIQFSRGEINALSIKNRYNHRVKNPDATFSNNLDNIIVGLTSSFEQKYNLNISSFDDFELETLETLGYVKANDGKYYKYNYEINNIYYCPNNIIIDNFEVNKDYYEKEKYIVADYFIIDLVNKKIKLYDSFVDDSFAGDLQDIKKIEINKVNNRKQIKLILNNNNIVYIELDKYNRITSYKNESLKEIKNNFLYENKSLEHIDIQNVLKIGDYFLDNNEELKEINLPNVKIIGNNFLLFNKILETITIPNVETIGATFLFSNEALKTINIPKVKTIEDSFLSNNIFLREITIPNIEKIGNDFLYNNKKIKTIELLNLKTIDNNFLFSNEILEDIKIPNIEIIKDYFLNKNKKLKQIEIPNTIEIGKGFLQNNEILEDINLLFIEEIKDNFLTLNKNLKTLNIPNVLKIGNNFLYLNNSLKNINLPKILEIGDFFLYFNEVLTDINIPNKVSIGRNFLANNKLAYVEIINKRK